FNKRGCEPFKVPGSDHLSIVKPLHSQAIQHLMLKKFIFQFIMPHYEAPLVPVDENETRHAYEAVRRLEPKLAQVMGRPEALGKLQHALFETRQYVERCRRGEPRDGAAEQRLAELWNDTGYALSKYDGELASLCWIKGHGWADERLWNDPRFDRLP